MDLSVIIPFHSDKASLDICLRTLLPTLPVEAEVIVVVNNTDEAAVSFNFDENRLRILRFRESLGYSRSINIGAKAAKGRYLAFSDVDTSYTGGWLQAHLKLHRENLDVGITSSKLIEPRLGRIADFGIGLTRYSHFHPFFDRPHDFPLTLMNRRVQMACSASMLISRDLFLAVGGLDEELVDFYQDVDLCLRLKDFKKQCWVVPDAIVFHKGKSAQSSRLTYQIDVRGLYFAKNFARMEVDIKDHLTEGIDWFFSRSRIERDYVLVDLTTIADREFYYAIIKERFPIADVYRCPQLERDAPDICLLSIAGGNLTTLRAPLLFLVDRHTALARNALWSKLRQSSADVIVDRHANVASFNDLSCYV